MGVFSTQGLAEGELGVGILATEYASMIVDLMSNLDTEQTVPSPIRKRERLR